MLKFISLIVGFTAAVWFVFGGCVVERSGDIPGVEDFDAIDRLWVKSL